MQAVKFTDASEGKTSKGILEACNIYNAVTNIAYVWAEVKQKGMTSAGQNHFPNFVHDFLLNRYDKLVALNNQLQLKIMRMITHLLASMLKMKSIKDFMKLQKQLLEGEKCTLNFHNDEIMKPLIM